MPAGEEEKREVIEEAETVAGPKLADDLLEGAEAAAEWTGFKLRSVYHMVSTNQIPFTRRGATLLFRKSELNRRFSGESATV